MNVQPKTQETQELCIPGRSRHAPIRYQLLVEADDNELLIHDESTNYIEEISNTDFDKWIKFMKYEIDSIYTNQVWTLVDPSKKVKLIVLNGFLRETNMEGKAQTYKTILVTTSYRQK